MMIDLRHEVIREAREWIGTPFEHQGRLKHVACDCIGLVWKAGEKLGLCRITDDPRSKKYLGYGRQPNPRMMKEALQTFFVRIDTGQEKPGDFAYMEWRAELPMHLAIIAQTQGRRTIIHAFKPIGKVAEHGFTVEWQDRVNSWWRYPGLVE